MYSDKASTCHSWMLPHLQACGRRSSSSACKVHRVSAICVDIMKARLEQVKIQRHLKQRGHGLVAHPEPRRPCTMRAVCLSASPEPADFGIEHTVS